MGGETECVSLRMIKFLEFSEGKNTLMHRNLFPKFQNPNGSGPSPCSGIRSLLFMPNYRMLYYRHSFPSPP